MDSTIETNNASENKDAEYWIKEGREFHLKDQDYENAIKCYDKAIQLSPNEASKLYRIKVKVFLDWGIELCESAEIKQDETLFQEALKKYDKTTKLKQTDSDRAIVFIYRGIALYGLAEIKQDGNLYREAVKYFIKSKKDILSIFVLLYKNNKNRIFQPKHFYQLLNESLDTNDALFFTKITESIKEDKTKLNEYKDIYLRSIFIISLLHIKDNNEKLVAHYSKKKVLQRLLFNNSQFRLNAIDYSNDPTEGKTLLDFLYREEKDKYRTNEELNDKEYEAFAGCFTFNYDSLNLFRLYGKEDGKEGTGLSLVFKNNFFNREAEKPTDSPKTDSYEKISLFRCIYIDPNPETKQPVVTVGQKEKYLFYREKVEDKFIDYNEEIENRFKNYNEKMNKIIEVVSKEMKELEELVESKELNHTIVGKLLLNLRYLVKHVAFKEEQECRIVKILNLSNNENIKIDDGQMYFEYPFVVPEYIDKTVYIDKIYFGPKAEGFELFKSMLKYKGLDIPCKESENPLA